MADHPWSLLRPCDRSPVTALPPLSHDQLLASGTEHPSPGGMYSFRVLGPCCRLFDREELPWPCCRLQWRTKEPSWRRVGRRFVPDLAARRCPSYVVELLQPGLKPTQTVLTLFAERLSPELQRWWYAKKTSSELTENPEEKEER